ncbi:MAG: hypothetical protein WA919_16965 [Coleofasciculaceae cyanobacterium]
MVTLNGLLDNTDLIHPSRPRRFYDDYLLSNILPGQQVQVNLDAGFDTYLQLVNADTGVIIDFNDDGGVGLNSQLTFTAQENINYILRATSFGQNVTGNYTLTTSTGNATPNTVIPVNQTLIGNLASSDLNNPTRTGRFSDDYTLRGVSAGQQVQINLSSDDFDTYLQLVNANTGGVITFNDDGGVGLNSQLTFVAQDGIDYAVRATSYGQNATGSYTLGARNFITGNQTLTSTLSSSDPSNPTRTGRFSEDYFLGGISAGQDVQVNLTGNFDTYLQLVNANTGQVISFDDDSGAGLNSYLNFTAQQGTDYILRVTSYGQNATGNYTLSTSSTTTRNFNLNFASSGQSIWNTGNEFTIRDNRFLGTQWDRSGSRTFLGLGVQGSTRGRVGLQSDFNLNGGTVNASLPIDFWLELPSQVRPGETVTISSGFSLDNGATFSTIGSSASYALDLILETRANAGVRGFGRNANIINRSINGSRNLLNLNSNNATYNLSESQLNGFGSFELHLPQINTQGSISGNNTLSSQGNDNFFDATLDLDRVATALLPIPNLEGSTSFGIGRANYNLLDVELDSELDVRQEFDLQVDELTGQLILENGERINFTVGEDITFTVPEGIGNSLEFDALLNLDADFSNQTILGYDVDLDLEALSLNGNVHIPIPLLPDINRNFSLGPVYDRSLDILSGEFNLFDRTFDLSGFNQHSLSFNVAAVT